MCACTCFTHIVGTPPGRRLGLRSELGPASLTLCLIIDWALMNNAAGWVKRSGNISMDNATLTSLIQHMTNSNVSHVPYIHTNYTAYCSGNRNDGFSCIH